ncbi:IS3 family transposase [Paenibacillus thalictri]
MAHDRFSRDQGFSMNRKRVRRLMHLMGLKAFYPKPNLSERFHTQCACPYLLHGLTIDRPNQV